MEYIIGIFILGAVIAIHEIGHYIPSKIYGVKVKEFSIGLPFSPKILTLFKHKETEFTIRAIPLGGFIEFQDHEEISRLPLIKHAVVTISGPLFNILAGYIIILSVFVFFTELSLIESISRVNEFVILVASGTWGLFIDILHLGDAVDDTIGPIGIVKSTGDQINLGFVKSVLYFSSLNIGVGFFNLLPIPILDGGQLVLIFIESITSKKVSSYIRTASLAIGLVAVLLLLSITLFNDIESKCDKNKSYLQISQ